MHDLVKRLRERAALLRHQASVEGPFPSKEQVLYEEAADAILELIRAGRYVTTALSGAASDDDERWTREAIGNIFEHVCVCWPYFDPRNTSDLITAHERQLNSRERG